MKLDDSDIPELKDRAFTLVAENTDEQTALANFKVALRESVSKNTPTPNLTESLEILVTVAQSPGTINRYVGNRRHHER